jgi:hypothetical protein
MNEAERHFQAALGYHQLGLFEDANDEIEGLPPERKVSVEVLRLRASIYMELQAWGLLCVEWRGFWWRPCREIRSTGSGWPAESGSQRASLRLGTFWSLRCNIIRTPQRSITLWPAAVAEWEKPRMPSCICRQRSACLRTSVFGHSMIRTWNQFGRGGGI